MGLWKGENEGGEVAKRSESGPVDGVAKGDKGVSGKPQREHRTQSELALQGQLGVPAFSRSDRFMNAALIR